MTSEDAGSQSRTLWDWTNAYKMSAAIFGLDETGVLGALAEGPRSLDELAARCGVDGDALGPLLAMLVHAGLLTLAEGRYVHAGPGAKLLPLVAHERRLHEGRMTQAVVARLHGGPGRDPTRQPSEAPRWDGYHKAMAVSARSIAPYVVRYGRPRPEERILDLGGADGTLMAAIQRTVPDLRGTVVDRETVREHFDARVRTGQGPERTDFVAADLRSPESLRGLLSGAHLVVLSNVLHLLTPAEGTALLDTVQRNLPPGGRMLVYDLFPSSGVVDAALFMLLDWMVCGYRFDATAQEFSASLLSLGFADVRVHPAATVPGAFVSARKDTAIPSPRGTELDIAIDS